MYNERVLILPTTNCSPYWHGKVGKVVDTEYDNLAGELYWTVKIDGTDVTVPFAEHELKRM
jgi:hypothetical protein